MNPIIVQTYWRNLELTALPIGPVLTEDGFTKSLNAGR